MITSKEVKVLDKNAEFFGTPQVKLMEEAGKQLALFVDETFTDPKICIFCGLGNNGGDGFVASRYLSKNHQVFLFLVGNEKDIKTPIARMNFAKLKQLPLTLYDIRSLDKIDEILEKNTIIIDAMLGIGLTGKLRYPYDHIVTLINKAKQKTIISCDVPTGLGLKQAIQPDHTITFHDIKEGMDESNCGTIHIKSIGIPKKAYHHVGPGELSEYYPRPHPQSHKGQNGQVLIIGGGPYTGAPALSALASLRTGVDLVTICVPRSIVSILASYSPNLIVKPLKSENTLSSQDIPLITSQLPFIDAVLIGPGLGKSVETIRAVKLLVEKIREHDLPLVIDADAIHALSDTHTTIKKSNTIITPHWAEFKDFTNLKNDLDLNNKIDIITQWAKKLGIGLLVKGETDIISDGTITRLNKIHNEAMTVGGTGDVLAGIIVGLLSKKTSIINAMRIAAFLNGEAGNMAFNEYSYGMCATDLIDNIPKVLKKYL